MVTEAYERVPVPASSVQKTLQLLGGQTGGQCLLTLGGCDALKGVVAHELALARALSDPRNEWRESPSVAHVPITAIDESCPESSAEW